MNLNQTPRCAWVGNRPAEDLMTRYHDTEWGVPEHDEPRLFELLTLEGAQAGLSWEIILKRREGYRSAFAGFDVDAVAGFSSGDVERLLLDPGIVRNRAKIEATISNAAAVQQVRREHGSIDALVWSFVAGKPRQNDFESLAELPSQTEESKRMSRELLRLGFRFAGPTICYAFMQAAGLVNDHEVSCFRHAEVALLA